MYTNTGCRISSIKNWNSGSLEAGLDKYPKFSSQINVCNKTSSSSMYKVNLSKSSSGRSGILTDLSYTVMYLKILSWRSPYSPKDSPFFNDSWNDSEVMTSESDSRSEAESGPASVSKTFLIFY